MASQSTPGVYIQEISTLPASIASVETAIPAFIGHTEIAIKDGESVKTIPTRITSMLEFEAIFGKANPEAFTITVEDTYPGSQGTPGKLDSRKITAVPPATPSPYKLYYSLQMYFSNGGGPCYIVSVNDFDNLPAKGDPTDEDSLMGGLEALKGVDEPTLIVFPDVIIPVAPGDTTGKIYKGIYDAALAQCESLKDRFVIIDVKDVTADPFADAQNFRNDAIGISNLKYGAAYYPNLSSALNYAFSPTDQTITHTNTYAGGGANDAGVHNTLPLEASDPADPSVLKNDPSLYRSIIAEINKSYITLPPSGAIAGIYARVDSQRGVWKAPANVDVRTVIGPSRKVSHDQQADLNVDATSGKSINAIRTFTGKGTLVWGARTLAGNDNEWRYVPVRRLYIFIEESVKKATEFVVFEPNDANTWLRTKTMIENFLSKLWRDGALAGAKPEEAFFVRVGLGQTMSSQDILEGRMNIEIGLAAVRPAEFIILKFSHKLQES
ncbi:phage tail sheath subtilisin-like domain-containing protein [Algoriphagus halophytocola]|uniref:Phage tail sheath subtilisin-like domain-containing protein n=1 Tax=Algoriphagus halophytocola TaxID=2991499 RepID=A0ABY6MHQ6_9BACT|nr:MULTISPECIES: phage tail sheath C-terminal domain-containing protein [unclassified Algoriphagus]UZD21714.1 phage tail sheath subtilisin-like domain-containing protein [Algoriphagus sp. TR-M5]WBL42926.1 phage tail sheath subtilisin-like domain-containing protein [Algoriphagus sp. TR-M9]